MSFTHQDTFLRSALVKDPFSLGDIGPEDVLRIQSQFPYLFDSTIVHADEPKQRSSTSSIPLKKLTSSALPEHKCCNCFNGKSAAGKQISNAGSIKPKPPHLISKLSLGAPCSPNSSKSSVYEKQRYGQLLSVNDLKRVLEEILWQKDLKLHQKESTKHPLHDVDNGSLGLGIKNILKKSGQHLSNPQVGKKVMSKVNQIENPFNMTSGDVTQSNSVIKNTGKKTIPASKSLTTVERHKLLRKAVANLSLRSTKSSDFPQKSSLPKVSGFLRPAILKTKPSPIKPVSKAKKSVQFSKEIQIKNKPAEIKDLTEEKEIIPKHKELTKISSPERSRIESQLQPFNLKGKGQRNFPELKDEDVFKQSDDASYHQLSLAHNLANKYEKIGLLRNMKLKRDSNEKATKAVFSSIKPSQQKISQYSPVHSVHTAYESTIKTPPTVNVLEKLAKELVYVEVLKHLHELQEKEKDMDNNQNMEDCIDIDQTNVTEPNSETNVKAARKPLSAFEYSYDKISTPELTPSNSRSRRLSPNNPLSVSKSRSHISTPNLTPSVPINVNPLYMNEPLVNNNDNTDCSDISDFIFSEKELKITPKGKPSLNRLKSESLISTPQLSSIDNDFARKSRSRERVQEGIHEKGDSPDTSNAISDFDYSSSLRMKNQVDLKENATKKSQSKSKLSKCLSSVTEELSGIGMSTRGPKSELSKSEIRTTGISRSNKSLTVSIFQSQTEMLSEGELIGNFYKSPGEVSLSQPISPYLRSSSSSTASNFTSEAFQPYFDQVYPTASTGEYL